MWNIIAPNYNRLNKNKDSVVIYNKTDIEDIINVEIKKKLHYF